MKKGGVLISTFFNKYNFMSSALKKYKPDEPIELSFIGSSLVRLGSAISGGLVASNHEMFALISVFITWFGHEMNEYFKLHEDKKENQEMAEELETLQNQAAQ